MSCSSRSDSGSSRLAMRGYLQSLPDPEQAWNVFLEFDARITQTIREEAAAAGIRVLQRDASASVVALADQALSLLGLSPPPDDR